MAFSESELIGCCCDGCDHQERYCCGVDQVLLMESLRFQEWRRVQGHFLGYDRSRSHQRWESVLERERLHLQSDLPFHGENFVEDDGVMEMDGARLTLCCLYSQQGFELWDLTNFVGLQRKVGKNTCLEREKHVVFLG